MNNYVPNQSAEDTIYRLNLLVEQRDAEISRLNFELGKKPGAVGPILLLLLALNFAAVGAYFIQRLSAQQQPLQPKMTAVPAAIHNLEVGTVIRESDLVRVQLRFDILPPKTVLNPKILVGRTTRRPIKATKPITLDDLTDLDAAADRNAAR